MRAKGIDGVENVVKWPISSNEDVGDMKAGAKQLAACKSTEGALKSARMCEVASTGAHRLLGTDICFTRAHGIDSFEKVFK